MFENEALFLMRLLLEIFVIQKALNAFVA